MLEQSRRRAGADTTRVADEREAPQDDPVIGEARRDPRITSTDLVFHRDGGLPIKDIRKRIDTAADRAGVSRFRPHDLRRSFVKFASDEGIDATTIMRFTGHRTDSTFRRYRIVDLETLERASAALSFAANRAEQATNRAEPEQLSLPP